MPSGYYNKSGLPYKQGFQTGNHTRTEFKKENKHRGWKGDKAGKIAMHGWIVRHKGRPKICEHCGKKGKLINGRWNLDWANKDHTYKRKLDEYLSLCRSCHEKYDYKFNQRNIK